MPTKKHAPGCLCDTCTGIGPHPADRVKRAAKQLEMPQYGLPFSSLDKRDRTLVKWAFHGIIGALADKLPEALTTDELITEVYTHRRFSYHWWLRHASGEDITEAALDLFPTGYEIKE